MNRLLRNLIGAAAGAVALCSSFVVGLSALVLSAVTLLPAVAQAAKEPVQFDVPEGWTDAAVPERAEKFVADGTLDPSDDASNEEPKRKFSLEGKRAALGLGAHDPTVALVVPGAEISRIYSINSDMEGNGSTVEHDVWLKVSGGTFSSVTSVGTNWTQDHNTFVKGNLFAEIASDATVSDVYGTLMYGGSTAGADRHQPVFQGKSLVVVNGKVTGNLAGGAGVRHNWTPLLQGPTGVIVKAMQPDSPNITAGGSIFIKNLGAAEHKGDTSVTIDLPDSASGNFQRILVGGSYARTKDNWRIEGNTSVTVNAPKNVTFTKTIFGASDATGLAAGVADVSGNSTVTLNGGTFAGTVVAGGSGVGCSVKGTAKMVLNGAAFRGADSAVYPLNDSSSAAKSELHIGGGTDLSGLGHMGAFGSLTLTGDVTLGTKRLLSAFPLRPLMVPVCLTLTLTEAEKADRRVILFSAYEGDLPDTLTVQVTNPAAGDVWTVSKAPNGSVSAVAPRVREWTSSAADADWKDGFAGFTAGDSVSFGPGAPVTVRISGDVRCSDMTVNRNVTLFVEENAVGLEVGSITVGPNGRLAFAGKTLDTKARARYVRFELLRRPNSGQNADGFALSEIALLNGGTMLWRNDIAAVTGTNPGSTGVSPLKDGNLDYLHKWYWGGAPLTPKDCFITLDAGEGSMFVCDGYKFGISDRKFRTPAEWRVAVSRDGAVWTQADERNFTNAEIETWNQDSWHEPAFRFKGGFAVPVSVGSVRLEGTLVSSGVFGGKLICADGARLELPRPGTDPLQFTGTASGTLQLTLAEGDRVDEPRRVLLTSEQPLLTVLPPVGSNCTVWYENGAYWTKVDLNPPFRAKVTGSRNLTDLAWTDDRGHAVSYEAWSSLGKSQRRVELISDAGNTGLTLDVALPELLSLTVSGEKTSSLTLSGDAVLKTDLLSVLRAAVRLPASKLAVKQASLQGTLEVSDMAGEVNTYTSLLTGGGTFRKSGDGTLVLKPAAAADGVLTDGVTVALAGGILRCSGSDAVVVPRIYKTGFDFAGGRLESDGWLTSDTVTEFRVASGDAAASLKLGGSGIVRKTGDGKLVLTLAGADGDNTVYTGETLIDAGTLRVDAASALTLTGPFSGVGSLEFSGADVTLAAYNSYKGVTRIGADMTLTLSGDASLGQGAVFLADRSVLSVNSAEEIHLSDIVANASSVLAKRGAGSLTAASVRGGQIRLNGGRLNIGTLSAESPVLAALDDGVLEFAVAETAGAVRTLKTTLAKAPGAQHFRIVRKAGGAAETPRRTELKNGELSFFFAEDGNVWNNRVGNGKWSTAENWTLGRVPADGEEAAVQAGVGALDIDVDNVRVSSLTVLGGYRDVLTVKGKPLTVTDSLLVNASAETEASVLRLRESAGTSAFSARVFVADGVTLTVNVPSGEWAVSDLSGKGRLLKTGAGTLAVVADASLAAGVIRGGLVLDVSEGTLRVVSADGSDPVFGDATLMFGTKNVRFLSSEWLKLEGLVTVDTGAYTELEADGASPVSLHGAGSLLKRGAGTFAWLGRSCDCHAGMTVFAEEGAVGLFGENDSFGGVVSGPGRVRIVRGSVRLSGANTHTGGTEVMADATLHVTAAGDCLGNGPLMGQGTVAVPRNTLPDPDLCKLLKKSDWKGTLLLDYDASSYVRGLSLAEYGNLGSAVAVAGTLKGHLSDASVQIGVLDLRGTLEIDNGYSGRVYTLVGGLTGSGTYKTSGNQRTDLLVSGPSDTFTGSLLTSGKHCVIFGKTTDVRTDGGTIIEPAHVGTVAPDATWFYTRVMPGAAIGGSGTVKYELRLTDGAILNASADGWLKVRRLGDGCTCALDGALTIRFPEGTVLPTLDSEGVRVLECETPIVMPENFTPTVMIGEETVAAAVTPSADGRSIEVHAVSLYETVLSGERLDWENLDWRLNGSGPALKYSQIDGRAHAAFRMTAEADVLVQVSETLSCHALMFAGAGRVTLNFSESMVTRDNYASISSLTPFELPLFSAINNPADFKLSIDALRYGATAFISHSASDAKAVITRESGAATADFYSINFAADGEKYRLPDDKAEGLIPLAGRHWTHAAASEGSNVIMRHYVAATDTSSAEPGGVSVSWKCDDLYYYDAAGQVLNRGYLDQLYIDAEIDVAGVPEDWVTSGYSIVIYTSTNDTGKAFTSKQLSDGPGQEAVSYTYDAELGKTVGYRPGEAGDKNLSWGSAAYNQNHDDFVEGQNLLVIRDVHKRSFRITSSGSWRTDRGCISALQLLREGGGEVTLPTDYTADASGTVRWNDLDWKADGVPVDTLPEDASVYLNLTGDTVLDFEGAAPVSGVTVNGQGFRLTLRNVGTFAPNWNFSSGLTLCLSDAERDSIPTKVLSWPGRILYTYLYKQTEDFIAPTDTVTEFAAGFEGRLHAAAGTRTVFSGGAVKLFVFAEDRGSVEFSGTTVVTELKTDRDGSVLDGLGIGNGTYVFGGRSSVTMPKLLLSDGGAERTATLILKDSALMTVTGANNSDANQASFLFGHWHGRSNLTIRDRAVLSAEQAEMIVGLTGEDQTLRMEGGEIRVKGITLSKGASGTNHFDLSGGRLLVGSEGLKSKAHYRLRLTMGRDASLGAFEDCTIDGADVISSLSLPDGVMTLGGGKGELTLADNYFFADAFSNLVIRRNGAPVKVSGVEGRIRSLTVEEAATFHVVGGGLETDRLTLAGTLFMDAGAVLNANSFRPIGKTALLSVACGATMAECGYLSAAEGVPPKLSDLFVEMVLNPSRENETFPPMVPVIVGPTFGGTPSLRSVAVRNDSSAMNPPEPVYDPSGLLGDGLYLKLSGDGVSKAYDVTLSSRGDHRMRQSTADSYTYQSFSASQPGSRMVIPEGGILLEQAAFRAGTRGASVIIRAEGTVPYTLMQGKAYTVSVPVTFDLTGWDLSAFVRGAVRGMPVSRCLMSGAVSGSADVSQLTVKLTREQLPEGFTARIAKTAKGIYLVVEADRPTRSVSVNLTSGAHRLSASESHFGLWSVPRLDWNELADVWISDRLTMAGRGGTPMAAVAENGLPTQIDFQGGVAVVNDRVAEGSLTRVFASDRASRTFAFRNLPFAAYRVVLTFASDYPNATYAPIEIGGKTYTMDTEYSRCNIFGNGGTIPADRAWGETRPTETEADSGKNTLVTDVISGADVLSVTLPALQYGKIYSGLAAIQIVEAPELTPQPLPKAYTLLLDPADAGNEVALAERLPEWVSASNASLTVSASTRFEGRVILKLPAHFEADSVTFARMLARTSVTLVSEDGDTAFRTLDASGLANLTMGIPCIATDFVPAAGVTRFEKMFDNNSRPYTIAADATLELSEGSGITTSMDVVPGFLQIDVDSSGVLRREYTETNGSTNFQTVSFSWRHRVYDAADPDNTSAGMVVLPGDRIEHPGRYHLRRSSADTPWNYTQTGGEAFFTNASADEGGMLLFNSNSATGGTANVTVSGGLLETTGIWAWQTGTKVNLSLSGDAVLRLGGIGLSVKRSGGSVRGTVSEDAVVETSESAIDAENSGSVSLTFAGGTLRALRSSTEFRIPLVFAAPADKPSAIRLPAGGRMTFGASASSGTGSVKLLSGSAVLTHAKGLGEAAVTVASGAVLEFSGISRTAGSVTFEPGASFVASNTTGAKEILLGARPPVLPADKSGMIFILNGKFYRPDQVTVSGNGLRFGTPETADAAVAWDPAVKAGTWRNGLAGAWWKDNKRYTDGAAVTFSGSRAAVTVFGRVVPASVELAGADSFTFAPEDAEAAGEIDISRMGAKTLDLGTDNTFDVPVITADPAKALVIKGDGNSYRLLGTRRGDRVVLFDDRSALNAAEQPVWLPDTVNAVTFAPHPGETQTLPPAHQAMVGTGTVTLAGGGSVLFPGTVSGSNWNGTFRGNFIVTDGTDVDFSMGRSDHGSNGDAKPYFRDNDSLALWRRISENGEDVPGFRLRNGATLTFSGSRGLIGSFADQDDPRMIANHPVFIGRGASMRYSTASDDSLMNFIPYGHRFNGDGASLHFVTRGYLRYGTSFDVFGIGDKGDPTEPTLGPDGMLTKGIRARIDGAIAITYPEKGGALHANVGKGSVLDFAAGVLRPVSIEKHGPGTLNVLTENFADAVRLHIREGVLTGRTSMRAFGSEVILENGTAIGPGMNLSMLRFSGEDCVIYADMSGNRTLTAEMVSFDGGNGSCYRIVPEGDADIPPARGRAPIKMMSWVNAQGIDSATFSLDDTIRDAGYALDVAEDGLYLKESQRWYRDLTDRVAEMQDRQWYVLEWNMHDAWARTDLKVPAEGSGEPTPGEQLARAEFVDYTPDTSKAIEAIFVVPSAARLPRVPSFRIKLDRETYFSSIRFVREDTLETVKQVSVSYIYVLTRAPLPGPEGTKAYTWVSYLAVEGSVPATVGEPEGVPAGYDTAVRDRTVLLYREASKPSVNISFTDGAEGTSSFISATDAPVGAEPFAGVYWSNVSTARSQVGATQDGFRHYRTNVKVNGVSASTEGTRSDIMSLDYIIRGMATDPSRHSGGERLAAAWLPGSAQSAIPSALLTSAAMNDAFVRTGWQLRLTAVPFRSYDLYLLMAGKTGSRSYSAVRIRIGDGSWKTYTFRDGWTAPVAPNGDHPWQGVGVGPAGSFESGSNLLHLRVQTDAIADLQIVSADAQSGGSFTNDDASNQGLAGLQIVSCDGAVYEKIGSNGAWSDATGWKLSRNDGSFSLTAWKNPTPDAPHPAYIPVSSGTVNVDRFVNVPYLRFFGEGRRFILDGTEPMLQAVTLDFSDVAPNSSVTIPRDIFLNKPQILLAPGMRISVPESSSETMVNDWDWGYATDDNGVGAQASVVLHKQFPGDLIIRSPMYHGAQIDAGTLWLEPTESLTNVGSFTGTGTLGKRGTGTVTINGSLAMNSPVPLHVSAGRLNIGNGISRLQGASPTLIVDGGTVDTVKDVARPANGPVWEVSNHGHVIVRGDCTANRFGLRLLGNGSVSRENAGANFAGYHFSNIEVFGPNNHIYSNSNGYGGAGVVAYGGFSLAPNASLEVAGSAAGLRIISGIVDVAEGAELVSKRPIGRGKSNGYGDPHDQMKKIGAGRWRICSVPSAKGDSSNGIQLDIDEGEVSVEIPGGSYSPGTAGLVWNVASGATLSGTSVFNGNTLLHFASGSVLRNGVKESTVRGLTLCGDKTNFDASSSGETVHDLVFDLRNSAPLTFTTKGPSVHGNGILRIKLEHPEAFQSARRLIAWPRGTAPNAWKNVANIVCSEVVALDAKFEIRDTASDAGLWLVPADALYLSDGVTGTWSAESTWKLKDQPTAFPRDDAVPTAKIRATAADARLTVDETGIGAADENPWMLGALVLDPGSRLVDLVRDAAADGNPAGSPVAISSALWKQGSGTASVDIPLIFGGHAGGVSVSVDSGILQLKQPIMQKTRTDYSGLVSKVNASMNIGAGATVRYAAVTDALDDGRQIFTGAVGGRGTFELEQPAPIVGMPEHATVVEIGGGAESTADFRVTRGTLSLSGPRRTVNVPNGRRLAVAAERARLLLSSEWGFGAGRDTELSLLPSAVEGNMPLMASAGREVPRIRGTLTLLRPEGTPPEAKSATVGGDAVRLDDALTVNVAEGNTLNVTAGIISVEDDTKKPSLTKVGKGVLNIAGSYETDADVTVAAGLLRFSESTVNQAPHSGATGSVTVNRDAALRLPEGNCVFDPTDGARLTMHSGSTFVLNAGGTSVTGADIAFEDGVVLKLESSLTSVAGALLTVGERASLRREGVVVVDLDVFDIAAIPETLDRLPIISVAADSPVYGAGTFVLGGKKQAEWAKAGWSLEVTRTSVAMVYFGGSSAYTWVGGKDNGNWMSANWSTPDATDKDGNLTATVWPADDGLEAADQYAVKLTDMSPLNGGEYIPADRRLLADDPAKSARHIRALWANISDEDLTDQPGDYTLTSARPDQDLYINGEILKSGNADLNFRRPVRTESEAGALRIFGGAVDFGSTLTSFGRVQNYGLPITFGGNAVLRFSGTAEQTLSGIIDAGEGSGSIERTGRGRLNLDTPVDMLNSLSATGASLALRQRDLCSLGIPVTLKTAADGAEASLELASSYTAPQTVRMQVNSDAASPDGVLGWQGDFGGIGAAQPMLGRPDGLAEEKIAYNVKALRYAPKAGHLILNPQPGILPETVELRLAGGATEATALWLGSDNPTGIRAMTVGSLTGTGSIGVEPVSKDRAAPWRDFRVLTVALEPGADNTYGGTVSGAVTADGHAITAGLRLISRDPSGEMATFRYQGISDGARLGTLDVGSGINAEVSGTWGGSVRLASGAQLSGSGTFGNSDTDFTLTDGAVLTASALGAREIENGVIVREVIPTEMNVRGTLRVTQESTLKVLVRTDKATKAPWVSCVNTDELVVPSAIADADAMHFRIVIDVEKGVLGASTKILGWKRHSGLRIGIRPEDITVIRSEGDNEAYDFRVEQRGDGLYLVRAKSRFWMIVR